MPLSEEAQIIVDRDRRKQIKTSIVAFELRNGFRPGVLTPMKRDYSKSRLDQFADDMLAYERLAVAELVGEQDRLAVLFVRAPRLPCRRVQRHREVAEPHRARRL